jgi:hypothetical protein
MEAMKCFPPTRHRTEKSGSKHPELRRIRPSTTTRHQVLTTASQSSIPACPVTSGTRRAAGSASPGRSHTTHRQPSITRCEPDRAPPAQIQLHPPPAAGHRTLPATPGSQTAATGLTPPTTDRDRSSEASCRTSIEPLHSQPLFIHFLLFRLHHRPHSGAGTCVGFSFSAARCATPRFASLVWVPVVGLAVVDLPVLSVPLVPLHPPAPFC